MSTDNNPYAEAQRKSLGNQARHLLDELKIHSDMLEAGHSVDAVTDERLIGDLRGLVGQVRGRIPNDLFQIGEQDLASTKKDLEAIRERARHLPGGDLVRGDATELLAKLPRIGSLRRSD